MTDKVQQWSPETVHKVKAIAREAAQGDEGALEALSSDFAYIEILVHLALEDTREVCAQFLDQEAQHYAQRARAQSNRSEYGADVHAARLLRDAAWQLRQATPADE